MMFPLDGEQHFIEMPLVSRPRTAATELVGIVLAKLATPLANGLVAYDHTTFKEEFFHLTKAEAESKVQPHCMTDDLAGKAGGFIVRVSGPSIPAPT